MDKFTILEQNPPQMDDKYVSWDSYGAGENKEVLWTDGIATCLAITLYDPIEKKGILAHISGCRFPEIPSSVRSENIINTLRDTLGLSPGKLEATLAGEAFTAGNPISTIVKRKLQEHKIPVIGEDLGSDGIYCGREVHFDCSTGRVRVYRYQ